MVTIHDDGKERIQHDRLELSTSVRQIGWQHVRWQGVMQYGWFDMCRPCKPLDGVGCSMLAWHTSACPMQGPEGVCQCFSSLHLIECCCYCC